ncbi:hypothetical protein MBANPS3_006650 [Mucor bainieri]
MYSKLPREWSPVAQRRLYKDIQVQDHTLYSGNALFDRNEIEKRTRQLVQGLLLLDVQLRNQVKTIDAGAMMPYYGGMTGLTDDQPLALVMLMQLCPNLTAFKGSYIPAVFYDAIANLQHGGSLQKLQSIEAPVFGSQVDMKPLISSYHNAVAAFKNTLKEITLLDSVGKTVTTTNDLIRPDDLQQFSRVEQLNLTEFRRVHLYRLKDYITNCSPNTTKSISIDFVDCLESDVIVYNDFDIINPMIQIQQLSIQLTTQPITPNEMIFLMQMFPALKRLFLASGQNGSFTPIIRDVDLKVVARFFDYLFSIPQVECQDLWFGVSEGLGLLPQLANSIFIQHLSVAVMENNSPDGLSIKLNRETQQEAATSSLTIEALPDDRQAFFCLALEAFKNKSITCLTIGLDDSHYNEVEKVNQELMDYIIDNFTSLQEVSYRYIAFPSAIPLLKPSQQAKSLRCLHLYYCQITSDYFTKLSSQLEHVDVFKFTTSLRHENDYNEFCIGAKIRIYLPYTTIDTIELAILFVETHTIKILTKYSCFALKAVFSSNPNDHPTLEAYDGLEAMPDATPEVIIHCMSLKKICIGSVSFKLPTVYSEQQ